MIRGKYMDSARICCENSSGFGSYFFKVWERFVQSLNLRFPLPDVATSRPLLILINYSALVA